jgi:hypothetical protein
MPNTKSQLDTWFRFLRDREHEVSPRFSLMVGYAYGYGCCALDQGDEAAAREKLAWLVKEAQPWQDRPDFPERADTGPRAAS